MSSIPIIVCGKNPNVAKEVRHNLGPEVDVIHVILSPAQGAADIPMLLDGKKPSDHAENVGSQNYGAPPVAVVLGGGYDDEAYSIMKDACQDAKALPWLRTKPPQTAAANIDPAVYGKQVTERLKATLKELGVGQKDVEPGLYWY